MSMRRYRVAPRFYMFIILFMLIFFGVSFTISYSRLNDEIDALNTAQAEANAIAHEIAELNNDIDYIATDEFVERYARENLGMLYPGEIRYTDN